MPESLKLPPCIAVINVRFLSRFSILGKLRHSRCRVETRGSHDPPIIKLPPQTFRHADKIDAVMIKGTTGLLIAHRVALHAEESAWRLASEVEPDLNQLSVGRVWLSNLRQAVLGHQSFSQNRGA